MHSVAVSCLAGKGKCHGALIGKDADVGTMLESGVEQPEEGHGTLAFEGRIHEGKSQGLGHVCALPQFQMTLWPASMASMTLSMEPVVMLSFSCCGVMSRCSSENASATSVRPLFASASKL